MRSIALRLDPKTVEVRIYQLHVWEEYCAAAGVRFLDELSRPVVEAYLRWLATARGRHGRVRARVTQLRLVEVVEQMWSWAHEEGEDRAWTTARVRRVTPAIPRPATSWRSSPTWSEMAACVRVAGGWLRPLLMVLYYTGLRPNQALRLEVEDLDVRRASLTIRPELGKSRQERSGRVIPVSAHLVADLAGLRPSGPYLLPCERRPRRPDEAAVVDLWQAAGVRPVVWRGRPHTAFRAGFQSGLLRADRAHAVAVEHLVGHKITDTAQHYLDPDAFGMREAVAAVPSLVSQWESA